MTRKPRGRQSYKAGVDKGTGVSMHGSGRSDARQYHYMQVAAALDKLPDNPTWGDVVALKRENHGFGPKSMDKLKVGD